MNHLYGNSQPSRQFSLAWKVRKQFESALQFYSGWDQIAFLMLVDGFTHFWLHHKNTRYFEIQEKDFANHLILVLSEPSQLLAADSGMHECCGSTLPAF